MRDWNAIVTAREGCWPKARRAVSSLGRVGRTGFYNVLVMRIDEPKDLLARLEALAQQDATVTAAIAHVSPAEQCFNFSTVEEFHAKAREAARALAPRLAGRTFHVRMHRRGSKGSLVSADEERGLADAIIEATRQAGSTARVTFDDPDAVVLLETVSNRAGIALWTRADRRDHPLLATG